MFTAGSIRPGRFAPSYEPGSVRVTDEARCRRSGAAVRRVCGFLALSAALVVAGVGGLIAGSPAHARRDSVRVGPRAAAALRATRSPHPSGLVWFVPTRGAPPTVAAENRQQGTSGWRLPGPRSEVGGLAYGPVRGYVSSQAVLPGQVERVYVNAAGSRRVRIQIFRIGWYHGLGGRAVLASPWLRAEAQPPCTHVHATGLTQCDWRPTLSFRVPSALASGVYIAKLTTDGGASDCLFVVEASRPQPLLVQLPTATYEAYNAWGGDSLYPGGKVRVGATGTTQGIAVSYDRPYDSVTGAGQFFARDVAMIWFLERYGFPVSYTTSESVDLDPAQLSGPHRALIDFGHSEYWSQRQETGFAHALATGTSLLFLGSDTLEWRVRFEPATAASSEAGSPDHVIVAYKQYAAGDPDRLNPTGRFPDGGARLTGSAYRGCITPRLRRSGPPTYLYYPWSPAPDLKPAWLFAHTQIVATTRIPGIVGYELDQLAPFSPPGINVVGGGAAPCMRAVPSQPGDPVPSSRENLAQTTLYKAHSGAIVFNTGTLGWELGLEPVPSASPDVPLTPNPRLVAMTRNLLAHVLGSSALSWRPEAPLLRRPSSHPHQM
jgi:hypothetical protein